MTDAPSLRYPGVHARTHGAKHAVIMAESGATMSYAELDAYANRLARLYQALGLKAGEHVAYCLENRLEGTAVQWGAHYAGLYYSFISSRLTPSEAAYIVADCDAKVVVLSDKTAPALLAALRALPQAPRLYTLDSGLREGGDLESLPDALKAFDAAPIQNTLEGSDMLYSSGTTGRPKGVKPTLTGLPLGSTAKIADLMVRGFACNADSVYLSPAPYYHAAPLKWSMGITAIGGTVVVMEKFDAVNCLRAIEQYRVTHSQWVPTMFHRLLGLPEAVKKQFDLSSHKVAIHAAAPCPIPTKQAMIDWWGEIVFEYYSCTEAIGMTYTDSRAWLKYPGTVGRALLGVPHIVGEDGIEVPVGHEGLVYFTGGIPFSYHKDPAKTAEAHSPEGWATVGDIGKLNQDGFLFLTDRKSNMIISGGVNVYPQETENVLITHPSVFDVAVIGTPHEDFGEEVRAVVQLEPGVTPSAALVEELIAYCRAQLSPIKCPRVIDFRDSLPREPNGKLLKRLLRDEYRAAFAKG
ncbi:MAG: acyl-CoA synthetase [Panacagrimonas sp.]